MADIFTATGAKFYIGPSVAATPANAAAYAALSWTEVTLVESLGDYGDESAEVTGAALGDGRMRKAKGARNAGTVELVAFHAADDLGQQAVEAAEATYNNYAFKVVLPNRLTTGGTDQIDYFKGLVRSKRMSVGNNDNLVRKHYSIALNSAITTVAPT